MERTSLGPWIPTFPEARWKEVAAALLEALDAQASGISFGREICPSGMKQTIIVP